MALRRLASVLFPLLVSTGVLATACSKKKSSTETEAPSNTAAVTANDGETAAVAGQLVIPLGLVADTYDAVMAVPVIAGEFQFSKEMVITSDVDDEGKFTIDLPQKSKLQKLMDNGLKSDGSVDRVFVEELIPEAADATDEQIIAYIEELKAKKEANPEGLEISYVLVAYFSGEDKLAEADSMSFIGMPTSGNPLLGLPITKAKGNLNLGKVTSEGATSVADLKADTTSFDMSEEALAAMTTVNDALKTFKNLYVNTDLEAETTVTITPTFNWEDSIASLKAGTSDPEDFVYEGYSSYIAPRGHDIPLDQACAETEADRLIFKITPPVAQSRTVGDLDEVIDSSNPLSNEGTVTSALKSENNGDRKSCLVGNNYFAGTDADGLEQIGGLDFPGIAPDGLWTLEKGNETFAKFDLGLSNPVAEDKHIKMFVPKLVMETSGGKITKFTITFSAWDEASSSYKELSDLSAFKRVVTEFGIGVNRYNDQGGSNEAGGARPDTIEGNAYVVEKFIDQAESEVSIDDPSEEATKGSIMLYYRAFGNSYNFFWMPE